MENKKLKIDFLIEKLLIEWKFIGLSKEKLKEKIILGFEEAKNNEVGIEKYK